ncbi:MAG: hypothetical protein JKY32_01260 [Rhizobiales bacterium]|nr:hypothetical protein [Hyphomicrobiales bacterium]
MQAAIATSVATTIIAPVATLPTARPTTNGIAATVDKSCFLENFIWFPSKRMNAAKLILAYHALID